MGLKYRLKENDRNQKLKSFQKERIDSFDSILKDIEYIRPKLNVLKQDTIKYYKENPESFDVLFSTDIIKDYLNDIKMLIP